MGLTATDSGGGSFEKIPEGTHIARCVQVVDLGTQYSTYYEKSSHKVMIGWEIPAVHHEYQGEVKPALIWNRYTVSLHENSNLRKDLEAWRGRQFTDAELAGFDVETVAGVECMLSVIHDPGGKYVNVGSVMAMPKGTVCPDQVNPTVIFNLDNWNQEVFDTFSDNLKNTINKSEEIAGPREAPQRHPATESQLPPHGEHPPDDEVPF